MRVAQQVRRLLPGRGRQPAQGGRQEGPRDHGQGAGEVRGRLRGRRATARELGTMLFDIIEPFADYAFNKSHAYGYGLVATRRPGSRPTTRPSTWPPCSPASRTTRTRPRSTWPSAGPWASRSWSPTSTSRCPTSPPCRRRAADRRARAPSPSACSAIRNVGEGLVERIVAERDANGPLRRLLRLLPAGSTRWCSTSAPSSR